MQVQFSPDGRWFVSASFDKAIKLWDGLKGTFVATMRAHVGPVYQVAWSSDSRLFVSGSKDSTLKVRHLTRARASKIGKANLGYQSGDEGRSGGLLEVRNNTIECKRSLQISNGKQSW